MDQTKGGVDDELFQLRSGSLDWNMMDLKDEGDLWVKD